MEGEGLQEAADRGRELMQLDLDGTDGILEPTPPGVAGPPAWGLDKGPKPPPEPKEPEEKPVFLGMTW